MNRVRLPKKINVAVGATCTGRGIWHNMLVRGRQGKDLKERKLSRHAKTHGPENEDESEGQRLYEKGLELIKNLNWSAARQQKRRF